MGHSPRRVFLLCLLLSVSVSPGIAQESRPPADLGLIEETGRRLIQVDVTVRGPAERVAGLTDDDFEVTVGGKPIEKFILDRTCVDHEAVPVPVRDPLTARPMVETRQPPGLSLMFFFDQYHLTAGGRVRAFSSARELVDRLVTGPNRAMVVSSGSRVRTLTPLTSDRAELLRAIDEAENDPAQLDTYATTEEHRIQQVYDAYNDAATDASIMKRLNQGEMKSLEGAKNFVSSLHRGFGKPPARIQGALDHLDSEIGRLGGDLEADVHRSGMRAAIAVAQTLQREEQSRSRAGLARFSMALAALADEEPPKAVVYYADTVRSNPGEHFLRLFGNVGPESLRTVPIPVISGSGEPPYDDVIDIASASGIRLYTVQALGLASKVSMVSSPGLNSFAGGSQSFSRQNRQNAVMAATVTGANRRFEDAENGLAGFALETGGRVFLGAAAEPSRIADGILADLTCLYLISFDPLGLEEDRALPVRVTVSKPGIDTRHRARLFVDSEQARAASRLSNAFYNAGIDPSTEGLRIAVIPVGFDKGKYRALVQAIVPASPLLASTWDIGLTVAVGGRVKQELSRQISVDRAGVPIVLEALVDFPGRPYEITAVAQETATGLVYSGKAAGEWPDPAGGAALIGPIALLQPTYGAFVRGDEHRTEGPLAHGPGDWVRPDLPTALVGVACRSKKGPGLYVDRRIRGASSAAFEPFEVVEKNERCGVFVDLIQSGTMTSGRFTYEVFAREGQAPAVEATRDILAVTLEEIRLAGRGP